MAAQALRADQRRPKRAKNWPNSGRFLSKFGRFTTAFSISCVSRETLKPAQILAEKSSLLYNFAPLASPILPYRLKERNRPKNSAPPLWGGADMDKASHWSSSAPPARNCRQPRRGWWLVLTPGQELDQGEALEPAWPRARGTGDQVPGPRGTRIPRGRASRDTYPATESRNRYVSREVIVELLRLLYKKT